MGWGDEDLTISDEMVSDYKDVKVLVNLTQLHGEVANVHKFHEVHCHDWMQLSLLWFGFEHRHLLHVLM